MANYSSPIPPLTGPRLREIRIYYNLTRKQMADKLKVSVEAVGKWETSQRTVSPAMQELIKLVFPGV